MPYILKHPHKEKSLLVLRHRAGLIQPFNYSTGEVIETKHWNDKAQRLNTKGIPKPQQDRNSATNAVLERHDKLLGDMITEYKRTGERLTKEILYNLFEQEFKIKPKTAIQHDSKDFYLIMDKFIADSKSGNRTTRKGTKVTAQRISHYETFKKTLQAFKPKLSVDDITMEFYKAFIAQRNNDKKRINTIGKEINILKVILRDTYKQGLHTNRLFENTDFKTFDEDVENVYLNDAELDVLWNMELNDRLSVTRDLFVIGCYTGLRISDLSKIRKSDIGKDGLLKVITQKTNETVYIPIHWRVLKLMEKYGGEFPKPPPDQRLNVNIKSICQKAEFTEVARYSTTKGGSVEYYSVEKYKKVSLHTARRSFATNMFLAGINPLTIRSITGHLTESSFMKYICVTKQQLALQVAQHPYFINSIPPK